MLQVTKVIIMKGTTRKAPEIYIVFVMSCLHEGLYFFEEIDRTKNRKAHKSFVGPDAGVGAMLSCVST